MIRWVFLDVGNILLDEDPLTFLSFQRHVEAVQRARPERAFLDLLAEREGRAVAGSRWPVFEIVSAILDEAECAEVWATTEREVRARFAELSPLIPGARELVERLARRFRLGLIANQGIECRARLGELGLLDRFEVVAFSEELDLFKPDPRLFRYALDRADAAPEHCLMVGDRLDNDLVPASTLGLATVWVRWPIRSAKGWRPLDPEAATYLASLQRSADLAGEPSGLNRPSRVVDTIGDVVAAIREVQGDSHGI